MYVLPNRNNQKTLSRRWLSRMLAVAAVLMSLGPATADQGTGRADSTDMFHALLVRNALFEDQELAALNLGVTVRDRQAWVWGTVATDDQRQRALRIVQQQSHIRAVHNMLFLEERKTNGSLGLPARSISTRPHDDVLSEFPELSLPGRTGDGWQRFPSDDAASPHAQSANLGNATGVSRQPLDQSSAASRPSYTDTILHPSLGLRPVAQITRPQTVTQRPVHRPNTNGLRRQLAKLQAASPRYRYLRLHIEEGRVFLDGTVHNGHDLHRFAHLAARTPGVTNVVINQVRVLSKTR